MKLRDYAIQSLATRLLPVVRKEDNMTDIKDYCERCYKHLRPVELILFDYNDNAAWLCFPCLKIVLTSLMALPLENRVERLQRWQQMWRDREPKL